MGLWSFDSPLQRSINGSPSIAVGSLAWMDSNIAIPIDSETMPPAAKNGLVNRMYWSMVSLLKC